VGANAGQISDAWSDASVHTTGDGYAGGLVGSNYVGSSSTGSIVRSYALGTVYSSGEIVGGLVGDINGGSVSLSYATGSVSGGRNVGGLVGRVWRRQRLQCLCEWRGERQQRRSLPDSHANIGGLVGELFGGYVSSVYSAGTSMLAASPVPAAWSASWSAAAVVRLLQPSRRHQRRRRRRHRPDGGADAQAKQLRRLQLRRRSGVAHLRRPHGAVAENLPDPYEVAVTGGSSVSKVYDGESATFTGSTGTLPAAIHGTLGFDGAVNAGAYAVGGLWSTSYDISYTGSSAT
jgi:hypothetical protein